MEPIKKCKNCDKEVESYSTAYLTHREKCEELCRECKTVMELNDREHFFHLVAEMICNELNGGDSKELGVALGRALSIQHRYLQNEFFVMLLNMFIEYKKHASIYGSDARNEWAVSVAEKWAKQ
jgi:hypothetical protein